MRNDQGLFLEILTGREIHDYGPVPVQIANIYLYRTKMCVICIRSRIKEHVPSVKENHVYLRHILQTIEALTSGVKCQYMCLLMG